MDSNLIVLLIWVGVAVLSIIVTCAFFCEEGDDENVFAFVCASIVWPFTIATFLIFGFFYLPIKGLRKLKKVIKTKHHKKGLNIEY